MTNVTTEGCLANSQVVTDADGSVTVVVSRPELRPRTAKNWLPTSTSQPDVEELLLYRNMVGGWVGGLSVWWDAGVGGWREWGWVQGGMCGALSQPDVEELLLHRNMAAA